jgi:UDP-glucose:(heptosyl)LPS alpha-1,3-glucosyltransferase
VFVCVYPCSPKQSAIPVALETGIADCFPILTGPETKMAKKRSKIAIMLPKLSHYGGVEGFAWRLAEALIRDYEVDFICSRKETEPPQGVRVICVGRPVLGRFVKILWFAIAAEWIRRKGHYDLTIGLGNTMCQDILRISGGPTRIFWKHSIRAYPQGFARTWKMIRRKCSPANHLVLLIEKLQIRHSRRIIANSDLVKEWTLEAFPHLLPHTVDVIYNQPDLQKFSSATSSGIKQARRRLGIPEDKRIIATAGTNFMLKGIGPLIRCLAYLPADTMLLVAGGRHCEKYQRLANKVGAEDRVRFLGKVDDMVTFYQASDMFILLSFYDACSNAVLEALAAGLPVISTTSNGSSCFLSESSIVDPTIHPVDLAALIARVLNSKQTASFAFPAHLKAGLDPYVHRIKTMLGREST